MFKNLTNLNLLRVFKLQNRDRQLIFVVVIALFLAVNILLSGISLRLDASRGKAYTLSASTNKILHNLDDLVNIKFFASSDLPARLIPVKTDVADMLEEYKKEAGNKIQLKIVDPKKDENALKEAREAGIPELQFSQLEKDKYAVTNSYFGISLAYGGKSDIIQQVTGVDSLEYNLTASIYKLTRKNLPKIGIAGIGQTDNPNDDPIASFRNVLTQQFEIENLDLAPTLKKIDPAFQTLFVFTSEGKKFSPEELKLLREYLNNRGKIIFFADTVSVGSNLVASAADNGLKPLLAEYGLTPETNLILSTSSEMVNFGSGQFNLLLPYPFWLKTNVFNPDSAYFSNISQLTFPWVSSLKIQKKSGLEITELVKTTNKSWEQTNKSAEGGFNLNPQTLQPPAGNELKTFVIVAESAKKSGGKIVLIPSGKFIQERYLGSDSGNLEFVLNIVNSLASGGSLAGIRSRAVSFYPLPDLPESQKDIFKYSNILLLPLLFAVWGGVRLLKRR